MPFISLSISGGQKGTWGENNPCTQDPRCQAPDKPPVQRFPFMKGVSCMNRQPSGPCYIQNANLLFGMMSIKCRVKGRLSPGCQFYHPFPMIQSPQKKYPETKQLVSWGFSAKTNSLGTTATLAKILIFSKTQSSLYVLYCKSIYPGMRSLFIKPRSELKLILIYVKQNHKKSQVQNAFN